MPDRRCPGCGDPIYGETTRCPECARAIADRWEMARAKTAPLRRIRTGPRRGLDRIEAADFVGVGASKFDEMVADGRMPKPKRIDGRVVWDLKALDASFDDLPDDGAVNPWDRRRKGSNAA